MSNPQLREIDTIIQTVWPQPSTGTQTNQEESRVNTQSFLPTLGDDKGILSAALHEHIRTTSVLPQKKQKKENITQTPRSWHTFRPKWNKLFILGNKRQPLMRKMSQPEGKPAEQHKRLWLMFIIYKLFFDFILCSYNKVCCLLHNNTFLALFYWFAHIQHLYTHTYNVQTPSEAPFRPGITKCPEWSKHRWRALSLSVHWHASWHVSPVPTLNMCTTGTKQRQNFVYDIWRIY